MKKWNGGFPTVPECTGCKQEVKILNMAGTVCKVYAFPATKWRFGLKCPMASHLDKVKEDTKFVDPLKAGKKKFKRR